VLIRRWVRISEEVNCDARRLWVYSAYEAYEANSVYSAQFSLGLPLQV
jgi:hypothetical protein